MIRRSVKDMRHAEFTSLLLDQIQSITNQTKLFISAVSDVVWRQVLMIHVGQHYLTTWCLILLPITNVSVFNGVLSISITFLVSLIVLFQSQVLCPWSIGRASSATGAI